MKNPPASSPAGHTAPKPSPGADESRESIDTSPLRTKRPGQVGLANEARPGLGTRSTEADPSRTALEAEKAENAELTSAAKDNSAVPHPPEERPAPSEQNADSLEQQQQRSTGVSGHAGAT